MPSDMEAALAAERARLRSRLGRFGVWRGRPGVTPEYAAAAERAGFGSVWIGGSPPADLAGVDAALAATERIVVATGIVNIWTADAGEVAESVHRIDEAHPGRFVLGIGVGHPEREQRARKPYGAVVEYLDALEARGVPPERLALAALGDRMLALAGERTLGAHPYFTPPEHSRRAREVLGDSPLLIPEQRVALETEPAAARSLLRPGMTSYFGLRNYRANLLRLGFAEEELDVERDDAIDRLATWGEADRIRGRFAEHLEAGADHVLAQLILPEGSDVASGLERLAAILGLR